MSRSQLAQYPVHPGDVIDVGPHRLGCFDLEEHQPFILNALAGRGIDGLYVDPPWGAANASAFRRKAGEERTKANYGAFQRSLIELVRVLQVPFVIEMGQNWSNGWARQLRIAGCHINDIVPGTYYRTKPMNYIIGGIDDSALNRALADALNGVDDNYGPGIFLDILPVTHVLDPCCGRGLTARHALYRNRTFTGFELAPYRAAGTLDVLHAY